VKPDLRQAGALEHPLEISPNDVVRSQRLPIRLAKNEVVVLVF
jgi:hypothetical protein